MTPLALLLTLIKYLISLNYLFSITSSTAPAFIDESSFNKTNKTFRHNHTTLTAKNTTNLNFATYIITQSALTDGPQRYSQFVTEAINWLNSQQFPPAQYCPTTDCCTKYEILLPSGTHQFSIAGLNDIKLLITNTGFSVWTLYTFTITAPVTVDLGIDTTGGCWFSIPFCSNTPSTISGTANTNTSVIITWNPTTRKATITPQPPIITIPSLDIESSCSFIQFLEEITALKNILAIEVSKAITNAILAWAAKAENVINLPTTFEAYPGVNITYFFTNLQFVGGKYAVATANGSVLAKDPKTKKWLTYIDYDIADAEMQPSTVWPWETIINEQVEVNGKIYNERLWLLNGLRVTSTLLTALIWAADTIGELTPSDNVTVLDATLVFNLTWDKPLLGIPYDNILSVEMGYGVINGTCYDTNKGKPPYVQNETTVISFSFTDLVGNGTVALDYKNNQVQIDIEVTTFNTSVLYPVLLKPDLPLPSSVVENLLRRLINDSIPMINSYFASHALIIPSQYAQWVPNPNLTLIHQPGCCNGSHGYIQFYSFCSCDEHDPQWTGCSYLPCDTSIKSSADSHLEMIKHALSPQQRPQKPQNATNPDVTYQIWLNIYSLTGSVMQSCDLDNMGDDVIVSLLNSTDGECEILSMLLPPTERYYILSMSSENEIDKIGIACNSQCNSCAWPPNLNEKVSFNTCYEFTYYTKIMLFPTASGPCIGGLSTPSQTMKNDNVLLVTYNGTANCQSSYIQIKNIGNITSKCVTSPNALNYNILNPVTVNGTSYYNLGMNCSNTCAKCHLVYGHINYNTCFPTIPAGSSMKFLYVNDSAVCGENNPNPTKSNGMTTIIVLSIVSGMLIILGIIAYWKRAWIRTKYGEINCHRPRLPDVDCTPVRTFCYWLCVTKMVHLKDWIIDGMEKPNDIYAEWNMRQKSHNFLLFIASLCIFLELIAWIAQSPWKVFNKDSFQQIGVPSDVLDITNLENVLDDWQYFADAYFGIMAIVIILSILFRFCCIRKICWMKWHSYRVMLLMIYIGFVFMGVYLLFPTFYEFAKSIKLNPSNSNALTGSPDIENITNTILGYSFVGVFLSYFSNVLLFWVHAIPVGIYIGTLFFIYYLFESNNNYPVENPLNLQQQPLINDYDQEQDQKYDNNDDIDLYDEKCDCCCCYLECKAPIKIGSRYLFKYIMSNNLKATMISRLIVIVWLLQAMASCVESLPVIIMYQSFGSNVSWIITWVLWWIVPILLLMHLWWICDQYIKGLRGDIVHSEVNIIKYKKHILYNGSMEIILFIVVMITSLVAESKKTLVAIWFLILTCFAAFVISAILWIFTVHYMFVNVKRDDQDNDNHDQIPDPIINENGDDEEEEEKDLRVRDENENENEHKDNVPIQQRQIRELTYDHHKPAYCCVFGCWMLLENTEIQLPKKYGARVRFRRLFLTLGVISYGYVSIKDFIDALQLSVKQEVIQFFDDIGENVSWPDNDSGGTLFDSTFKVYNTARIISCTFGIIAFILFFISLLCDWCIINKRGLKLSKIFGWISILSLVASIFGPSLPNYLSSTPIDDICPYCAPQFTNAIYLLFGDIVGLFCSGLFTLNMLPILVGAVTPAIARSSYMVLHYHELYEMDANERDTLRYIFICGSFLGPFVTFAPLLVYQQFMGDVIISLLLMIFWIVPIAIAINIKTNNATRIYTGYMFTYYGTLLGIFIYHWARYGLPAWLVSMIETPHWIIETILEIIAEWCLTNVLLSDFLYTILMGFRLKKFQDLNDNDNEQDDQADDSNEQANCCNNNRLCTCCNKKEWVRRI